MNDTLTLTLIISGSAILLVLFIALIIFVCTYHTGIYRRMKKPVKAMGIIEDAELKDGGDEGNDYYVITYSYTDNAGIRRTNTFEWQQNIGKASDKIALHYDTQNPQNSIADCQLKYGKGLWWKVLIILAALIILAIFIVDD